MTTFEGLIIIPKIIDLTGQKFGYLIVDRKLPKEARVIKNKTNWVCICEYCGEEHIKTTGDLRRGRTNSCNCVLQTDLTGNRYGRLTVIERTEERSGTAYKWLCKCDCGNYVKGATNHLKRGNIKSCGCITSKDLTGETFGMLTVKGDTGKRTPQRGKIWLCECECGNEYEVRTDSLTTGNTTSCGCLSESKGEKEVREFLEKNNIKYEEEYTFDDLIHVKPLRYDFGILDSKGNLLGLIEYDGRQHFEMTGYFGGIEEFELYQERDQIKNEYAEDNNIPLLRIPYTEYENIEQILTNTLKIRENTPC